MSFEDYFADERILHYIFKCRAKAAKRRDRRQLIYNVSGNPKILHGIQDGEEDQVLQLILPPRRKWKKLDAKARRKANGQPLNSLDKTIKILRRTVKWYKAKEKNAPFLAELDRFCNDVRAYATAEKPVFNRPRILPMAKERTGTVCRPIAVYSLVEKIAICITNRYLSERFDSYFEDCSFAFRMPEPDSGYVPKVNHHHAFDQIIKIRHNRKQRDLWVAECDIQKFYDTVSHSILKRVFKNLVSRVNRATPSLPVSQAAVRIFLAYLESYTFNKNVLPLNDPQNEYFTSHRMKGSCFEWVADELQRSGFYRSFNNAKIGVPQGGALSGLIANILLDRADKAIAARADKELTYVRYCDDMILMHPVKRKCDQYMNIYETELKKLKLACHASHKQAYGPAFWKMKSKKPYKWGPKGPVPWVGFVGYEININGDIRVRKTSLAKEMEKQRETVQEVIRAIAGRPRVNHKTIEESITNRLVQMSVGRVRLYNYRELESDLCWVKGFRLINCNKYSKIQMKRLDACRNNLLRRLKKYLNNNVDRIEVSPNRRSRQIVYYGKPFSYYYHAIEKSKQSEAV